MEKLPNTGATLEISLDKMRDLLDGLTDEQAGRFFKSLVAFALIRNGLTDEKTIAAARAGLDVCPVDIINTLLDNC